MATFTPNLNLKKPDGTDYVRVNDFNENANVLDGVIGNPSQLNTAIKTSLVLALNEINQNTQNAPHIGENGNWFQWNAVLGQFEDTGEKAAGIDGEDGVSVYVWIRWAQVLPDSDDDMQTIPADYIGIYAGTSTTPPSSYTAYQWYKYKGETGRGITSVSRTSGNGAPGTTDIYTIIYSDSTTSTFGVYNGSNGQDGIDGEDGDTGPAGPANELSIGTVQSGETANASITGTAPSQTLNLTLPKGDKGDPSTVPGPPGTDGQDGEDGRGIVSVVRTSGNGAPGTTDTYTITFTDSTTTTFGVYNGANGEGAGDMVAAVYDPNNKASDAFSMGNMVETGTAKIMTDVERAKLTGIESGAQANVKSDWNASSGDAEILNKPVLGALAAKDTVATADIADTAVTNAKLANMPAYTVKGRNAASAGVPSDVTMLDVAEYGLFQGTTATSVADAEFVSIPVSATSLKKITWANVKATLKTYFDTLYAKVADILSLGETASTAYRGDRGKTAYDHSQASGNPHGTTAAQVGAMPDTFTESDPTVPAWAKEVNKPSYTAAEVGADASGTASSAVSTHNSSGTAHSALFGAKQNTITASGLLKGNGTAVSAAVEGTDFIGASDGKAIPERISADIVTVTANTTLGLTHAGKRVEVNSSSALTVTIPPDSSVAFPVGTEIELSREGTGTVTVAPGSGVTLTSPDDNRTIDPRYGIAILKKRSANNWRMNGDLG